MRALLFALAWMTAGCGGAGGLGQSQVHEPRATGSEPLDAPLAIGASFEPEVKIETQGSAAPPMHLVSARPDVIAVEGGMLHGKAPGVAAVLFETDDGNVLDFLHIWVAAPTRVTLERLTPSGNDLGEISEPIELLIGDQVTVAPRLYAGSQRLAGHYDVRWHVDPPRVRVLRDGAPDRRRLVAEQPGTAKLVVESAKVKTELEIIVISNAKHPEEPSHERQPNS